MLLAFFGVAPAAAFGLAYLLGVIPGVVAVGCIVVLWLILAFMPLASTEALPNLKTPVGGLQPLTHFPSNANVEEFFERMASLSPAEWNAIRQSIEAGSITRLARRDKNIMRANDKMTAAAQSIGQHATADEARGAGFRLAVAILGAEGTANTPAVHELTVAAGDAAAAVAVRKIIPETDFDLLYGPFREVIPTSTLGKSSGKRTTM